MANTITPYDRYWYANRALERLERSLMFAKTLFRAYDAETREPGSTVRIRKPGGLVAQAMPITTATDLDPTQVDVVMNVWQGVAFKVGDKERGYTGDRIIAEHIDPAMQALAEFIETTAYGLILDVPWRFAATTGTPPDLNDLPELRRTLNENSVPQANRWLALSSERDAYFLKVPGFYSASEGAGGAQTQTEGVLGRKFGFNPYYGSLLPTYTTGSITSSGTVALVGAVLKGATSVTIDGSTTLAGTAKKGDTFTIAGDSRPYAITADATAAGNAITVSISPPARQAYADNAVVTFGTMGSAAKAQSLAYHPEAFGIVMARLPESGNGRGAEVASVGDPRTNLAVRVTRWYEPKDAEEWVRFDALFGVKTLDADRAVRYEK